MRKKGRGEKTESTKSRIPRTREATGAVRSREHTPTFLPGQRGREWLAALFNFSFWPLAQYEGACYLLPLVTVGWPFIMADDLKKAVVFAISVDAAKTRDKEVESDHRGWCGIGRVRCALISRRRRPVSLVSEGRRRLDLSRLRRAASHWSAA